LQKSTVFRLLLSYLIGLTGPDTVQAGLWTKGYLFQQILKIFLGECPTNR
jgi:hypothetical protein